MKNSYLILTDSGGIQEEAPALGKPVLVLRNETERPEAIKAGVVKIVGPDRDKIVSEAKRLLVDPIAYKTMAKTISPYGDGRAAMRIVNLVHQLFSSTMRAYATVEIQTQLNSLGVSENLFI